MAANNFVVRHGLIVNTNIIVTSGANVGIGNTTPNARLQVTGTANVSGNTAFGANVAVGGDLTVTGTLNAGTISQNLETYTANVGGTNFKPTVQVLAANGSAATPSFSYLSDPNTGIYRSAEDQQVIVNGGIVSQTINSTFTTVSNINATANVHAAQVVATGNISTTQTASAANLISTVQVLGPSGSVTAPSHSYTTDPTTGIYRSTTGTQIITSAGANTVTVNSTAIVYTPALSVFYGNTTVNSVANSVSLRINDAVNNLTINSTALVLANSTVSFAITRPTAAQVTSGTPYLGANGTWQTASSGYGVEEFYRIIDGTATPSNTQTFNASGTWTKPATGKLAVIVAWGGGGSGARNSNTTTNSFATGGQGGAFAWKVISVDRLSSTETVTIGAGGVSRVANGAGAAGGNTTFGSILRATGGMAGPIANAMGYSSQEMWTADLTRTQTVYNIGIVEPIKVISDTDTQANVYHDRIGLNFNFQEGGMAGGYGGPPPNNNEGAQSKRFASGGGGTKANSTTPGGLYSNAGTSVFGGNGGNAAATGFAGAQPGGGGGGGATASGAGGDGRVVVYVFG